MGKIIIVGLGNMGLSHLRSFLKSKLKFRIFIVEKDKKRVEEVKKIFIKEKVKNFYLDHKVPKSEIFDFAIISTRPKERLQVIKELLLRNRVKILFLEKFLFCKIENYRKFSRFYRNKVNYAYVNIWSEIFLKLLKIKKNKTPFIINVTLPEKRILTNVIHFYEIFRILSGEKFKINFEKLIIYKKIDGYHEGTGKIEFSKNNSKMIIKTKKMENTFIFNYQSKHFLKTVKFKKGNIVDLINKDKKIKFPLASSVTCKFYEKVINNKNRKNISFPKYELVEKSSKRILNILNNHFKKKIFIL